MSDINSLLNERLNKSRAPAKTAELAKQSMTGNLTGFSGIFSVAELTSREKSILEDILISYGEKEENLAQDLGALIAITSEVKAIHNQAALLHGERIKKAQNILKKYKEGAFTAWLLTTYGNRQTPYNFLQYFEFYISAPQTLKPRIEAMPRQAIYTLASRMGATNKKYQIVENYRGETKTEVLQQIRKVFPLEEKDQRKQKKSALVLHHLEKAFFLLEESRIKLTKEERKSISTLLEKMKNLL